MASQFLPQGLYSPRRRNGAHIVVQTLRGGIASAYGSNIFIGDPIKLMTTGVFELAAAGDAISGVFAGWNPEDPSVYEQTYWKAGTTYTKPPVVFYYPADDDTLFNIVSVGTVAQAAIGDAADHLAGTGNTNSGISGAYLDTANLAGAGAGSAKQYKIQGLTLEPGNNWGDTYVNLLVMVNSRNLGFVPGNAI